MSTLTMSEGYAVATAGSRILGFEIIRPVGEGAGSTIYIARDPATGKTVALKYVPRKNEKDIRFVEQLQNEFEVSKKFNHPGLRKMLDVKIERTLLRRVTGAAVIMEWVDGKPLDQELPTDHAELGRCFIKVAEALGAMHKSGYVHCDLKPANILYNAVDGSVRVIDLGQACPIGTKKERIQGTPDYISPEQVKRLPVDERTDVYSLGATLYWCLCGQRMPTLFTLDKGENSFLVDTFIKSPHDHNPLVPEPLSSFVMECARTTAAKRPANMQQVAQRLEVILIGLSK
jgi:eukaryotic-like serine/threonine-protein kinase